MGDPDHSYQAVCPTCGRKWWTYDVAGHDGMKLECEDCFRDRVMAEEGTVSEWDDEPARPSSRSEDSRFPRLGWVWVLVAILLILLVVLRFGHF